MSAASTHLQALDDILQRTENDGRDHRKPATETPYGRSLLSLQAQCACVPPQLAAIVPPLAPPMLSTKSRLQHMVSHSHHFQLSSSSGTTARSYLARRC